MTDAAAALIMANMPASVHRQSSLAALRGIPHAGNRLWLAKWAVHLLDPRSGKPRTPNTVSRVMPGPAHFLTSLQTNPVEDSTAQDLQAVWIRALHEPHRGRGNKGQLLDPHVRYRYQKDCLRFLTWALGPSHPAARTPLLHVESDTGDPVSRTVSWEKLARLWADLSGMNLAYLILLVASGLSAREIRGLPVDSLTYDGPMCLIRCPPTRQFPRGRTVALHHGDEVLAAYQAVLRRDNPGQKLLFPQKADPDKPLPATHLALRVKSWGHRIGIPELQAEDLRLTYICYLLARQDVGEHYVRHAMGLSKMDRIKDIARAVERARLAGHDFGQPVEPTRGPSPGHRPCTACGKRDNPVGPQNRVCSGCGTPFGDQPVSKAHHILADLADAVRRLQDITGQTRTDRAQAALADLRREAAP